MDSSSGFSGLEIIYLEAITAMAAALIVDTHTHICESVFDADREQVLEKARDAGVKMLVAVGENLADAERNLALSKKYRGILPAAGLYPAHVDPDQAREIQAFIRKERHRLCAIGEVGLDRWVVKDDGQRERQQEIFKEFIHLSLDLDLPLNVHSRSAGRHAVALLLDSGAKRVQLHAFDGKSAAAQPAVAAGYFFSIPPSVVRSRQKQKLVKNIPLSSILVETDSPVLGPEPDVRNEPVNIIAAIDAIAELKQVHRQEVVETVYRNTCRLYGDLLRFVS